MKKYDLAVYIGRFQPFHCGHQGAMLKAYQYAPNVLMLVGSSNIAPNIKNPFTFAERKQMILDAWMHMSTTESLQPPVVEPLTDHLYSDLTWVEQVQNKVREAAEQIKAKSICLIGYEKDESSFYLKLFPQWHLIHNDFTRVLSATTIRDQFLQGCVNWSIEDSVPGSTYRFLRDYSKTDSYKLLCKEYEFIKAYKSQFEKLPYPPIFVTGDAVVLCRGHVLLVKRKSHPGQGLWALPGGFLQQHETIAHCIVRELVEETRISVSDPFLLRSIIATKTFDAPGRSLRGRTITHAGLIVLHENPLPKVRGSDDAEHAKWFPIAEIHQNPECFFEDHYSIISTMLHFTSRGG